MYRFETCLNGVNNQSDLDSNKTEMTAVSPASLNSSCLILKDLACKISQVALKMKLYRSQSNFYMLSSLVNALYVDFYTLEILNRSIQCVLLIL